MSPSTSADTVTQYITCRHCHPVHHLPTLSPSTSTNAVNQYICQHCHSVHLPTLSPTQHFTQLTVYFHTELQAPRILVCGFELRPAYHRGSWATRRNSASTFNNFKLIFFTLFFPSLCTQTATDLLSAIDRPC